MTVTTDKVTVPGGTDHTFVCKKNPFAISCSDDLPHGEANLIDLDLVLRMKIPLRNIRVTRMSLLGHDVRAVGRIKQTVQCVVKGKVQGDIHLEAKVVRDLFSLFNVDCVASSKTYERLLGRKPPEPPDEGNDSHEEIPSLESNVEDEDESEGKEREEKEDSNVKEEDEEEEKPPDPHDQPSLTKVEDEYTKYGFKDFEDALENAPWSHACIPRESDTWRDEIAAADKGYPDTRYDYVTLAMLRQGLANLEPMDQDHDKGAVRHVNHPRQLRGPRSRRKATQDKEQEEYTAEELAVMHGYPLGPAGRARRIV